MGSIIGGQVSRGQGDGVRSIPVGVNLSRKETKVDQVAINGGNGRVSDEIW